MPEGVGQCPAVPRGLQRQRGAEGPGPGIDEKAVIAAPEFRGIGVLGAGGVAVVDQQMRRCVVAEEHRDVDPAPEQDRQAAAGMDQLVRVGIADLPEVEARRGKGRRPCGGADAGCAGQRRDHRAQKREMRDGQHDVQAVCVGEILCGAAFAMGRGDEFVGGEGDDRDGH